MLRQRVITALIMAGLFLLAVAFLALPWLALLFGVLICLAAWEWSGLCGWHSPPARGFYVLAVALVLGLLYHYCQLGAAAPRAQVQPVLGIACLWWSLALLWVKGYPASAMFWRVKPMRALMGMLVLAPAWVAAVYLLSFPRGGGLVVLLVVVVATADIGAYFSGKHWGRHKLAEVVSPKKTWEGFWGGITACTLLALLLWSQLPDQQAHVSLAAVLVVTLATALASVVGDLTVSMVKREAGVKDSGSLLPGHGGLLDRLDSICGAAPVLALGLLLAGVVGVVAGRRMVSVLGSTGSIGISTLDVIARHPDRFGVYALAANASVAAMQAQCLACSPRYAVMMDESAAQTLRELLPADCGTEVLQGEVGLAQIVTAAEVDTVMAAIVGAAGLPSALAAARAGKTVLLANKESLVMGGHLLMEAVRQSGARLLPIDSEHNAIFQCMPVDAGSAAPSLAGVSKVLLTASGGPFRQWSLARMHEATPEQACAHPNWSMGRKISVDSASLMNKGLELIEACWIFDLAPGMIEVVVHPQSIIHSMVQYRDGSVLAQMGNPDMRTPIAYGLGWPERLVSGVAPLDLIATARLDFEAPDEGRFPCLRLAREAVVAGGTAMAVCNAANEVAVAAFLHGSIRFTAIPAIIERTLERMPVVEPTSLVVVESADAEARQIAAEQLAGLVQCGRKMGLV